MIILKCFFLKSFPSPVSFCLRTPYIIIFHSFLHSSIRLWGLNYMSEHCLQCLRNTGRIHTWEPRVIKGKPYPPHQMSHWCWTGALSSGSEIQGMKPLLVSRGELVDNVQVLLLLFLDVSYSFRLSRLCVIKTHMLTPNNCFFCCASMCVLLNYFDAVVVPDFLFFYSWLNVFILLISCKRWIRMRWDDETEQWWSVSWYLNDTSLQFWKISNTIICMNIIHMS